MASKCPGSVEQGMECAMYRQENQKQTSTFEVRNFPVFSRSGGIHGMQRQEACRFDASLGYTEKLQK